MPQTEADWMTSSRPYRILAGAIEIRRRGQQATAHGQKMLALAEETARALETDMTTSPYGRFRVQGYRKAMES